MSYKIYTNGGTLLTTIPNGKINTTSTSLVLTGRDFLNYGRDYNQNIVSLLTNFSGPTQPTSSLPGQLWYDNALSKLKVFSTEGYEPVGKAAISETQPVGQEPGEFWWDTEHRKLNFLDDNGQYQSLTAFPRTSVSGPPPTHSDSTGVKGQTAWDTNYFYVCTATNAWSRISFTSGSW